MSGYTPVFDTVFDGSMCGKWPVLPVWLTLLPLADWQGHIDLTPQAIAGRTGWPMALLMEGIGQLCLPDPDSRSKAEEGRRLVPIDPERSWGWRVVNIQIYRRKCSDANQVSDGRNAEKVKRYKDRHRRTPPDTAGHSGTPQDTNSYSYSYSDTNSDSEKKGNRRAKMRAARAHTAQRLPDNFELTEQRRAIAIAEKADPDRQFAMFCDHWRAASGANARKHDWDAAWRNWCRKAGDFTRARPGTAVVPERTWRPNEEEGGPC